MIVFCETPEQVAFEGLDAGDLFQCDNVFYIKIRDAIPQAVCIQSGMIRMFSRTEKVNSFAGCGLKVFPLLAKKGEIL